MSGSTAKPDQQPGWSGVHFRLVVAVAVLFSFGLSACVNLTDFENAQVLDNAPLDYINPDQQLGQSITVRRSPLNGIQLWLRLSDSAADFDSQLVFHILSGEQLDVERYAGQINYQQIASSYPILITFPEQKIQPGETILLTLEASGSPVWIYGRAEDSYSPGQFFRAGTPVDADAAFRLTYVYNWQAAIQDLGNLLSQAGRFALAGLILLLPGWVLLQLSGLRSEYSFSELVPLTIGLSLAAGPVLMSWTSQIGLSWSKPGVLSAYFLLAIVGLSWETRHWRIQKPPGSWRTWLPNRENVIFVLLIGIFLATLFVRFAMVRDLSSPAWVDPVHHALISRLIETAGQIPATFSPYASTPTVNYHTGFHVTSALYNWLTGQNNADSLLFFGQILNAAAVFAAYLLAHEITGSRLAGLIAALVTGFATPMPAYYTSWGRYTHLAGILILPAGFVLLRRLYSRMGIHQEGSPFIMQAGPRQAWKPILLAALCTAGLFLVHTRVAIFLFALLMADLLVAALLRNWRINHNLLVKQWIPLVMAILGAGLLALPEVLPLLTRLNTERAAEWSQTQVTEPVQLSWRYITTGLGEITFGAALLGCLVAVFRRLRVVLVLLLWVGFMFLSANIARLGLPINLPISNDSVLITLFLPTGVAVGVLFAESLRWLKQTSWHSLQPFAWVLVCVFAGATAYFGARSLLPIINPVTVYFRLDDRQAVDWINANLPAEARFLINPAPWGYGVYVGADGGYWISPLTGRQTFPPTLLYAHGSRDDIARINQQSRDLLAAADDPQEIELLMQSLQLDYIFLGARGGPISPEMLLHSRLFELIYHQGGTWIFRVNTSS